MFTTRFFDNYRKHLAKEPIFEKDLEFQSYAADMAAVVIFDPDSDMTTKTGRDQVTARFMEQSKFDYMQTI